jgi:solute carrier family 25 uncoupling protein 8/9
MPALHISDIGCPSVRDVCRTPRKYPSAFAAYGIIARTEGVAGLWTGVGPNIGRNALINAAELASYDQVKQSLLQTGHFKDNEVTHVLAGLGAGFVAVCVGSPVDVVKSRVMGDKIGQYNGMFDCFAKTYAKEGLFAFYKGFAPNFARLGSWNVVMFMSLEKVKKLYIDNFHTPHAVAAPL